MRLPATPPNRRIARAAALLAAALSFVCAGGTARAAAAEDAGSFRVPFQVSSTVAVSHPGLPVAGGIPLPPGVAADAASLVVADGTGAEWPAQINPLARWPDGSLKWVLVLFNAPQEPGAHREFVLAKRSGGTASDRAPRRPLAQDSAAEIRVDTGAIGFSVPKSGPDIIRSLERLGADGAKRPVLGAGGSATLFAEIEKRTDGTARTVAYEGAAAGENAFAVLEENGPERAVIRIRGTHRSEDGTAFAPFTVRLYARAGSDVIRVVHSFVYDGDPGTDFLKSIGFKLRAELPDLRSFTFGGESGKGHVVGWNEGTNRPVWTRAVLAQNSSTAYTIRKWIDPRTNSAVQMEEGGRSQGWGRLDAAGLSVAVGLRNFRQEYPKAVEVDGARREITAYIYSPYGEALDLRRYSAHTHSELYETSSSGPAPVPVEPESDWRDHIGTDELGARYIAKTSEFFIEVGDGSDGGATSRNALHLQDPPRLTAGPEWIARTRVFGDYAAGPAGTSGAGETVAALARFLVAEQENRKWYSFLDYGDLIHSYDPARGVWCRDEGGYAWNNNEHCISEGLWSAYLRTGEPGVFRLAEAMTRHVGDVDMYHGGPLAGNGTRHNVNHYGCVAKKRRMTLPENKRVYYYLTGDERTRDLIHFIHDSLAGNALERLALADGRNTMDLAVHASALLFLWETTGDPRHAEMLRKTTEAICAFRIGGRGIRQYVRFDEETGEVSPPVGPGLAETKFRLTPKPAPTADAAKAQTKSFLLKFGPMDLLLNTAELTGSAVVHAAILDWAELLHMDGQEAAKYQGRFKAGIDCGRVAAYAYRHTGDERFLRMMEKWLAKPDVWIGTAGTPGDPLDPVHAILRNGDPNASAEARASERFQLRDIADYLRNAPYCEAAVASAAPSSTP